MTVKELVSTVEAERYAINSQGFAIPLVPSDPLQMDAFGAYEVERADVTPDKGLEITLKTVYIKAQN